MQSTTLYLPAVLTRLTLTLFLSLTASFSLVAQGMEVNWARIDGSTGWELATKIAAFEDASCVTFGYSTGNPRFGSYTLNADQDEWGNFLVRYSADGAVRWAVPVNLEGFHTSDIGLKSLPDGSTILVSYYTTRLELFEPMNQSTISRISQDNTRKGFVVRYDAQGKIKMYIDLIATRTDRGPMLRPRDVHASSDGVLTISGQLLGQLKVDDVTLRSGSRKSSLFVLRLDAQGQAIWGNTADAVDWISGNLIAGTPDGGVVLQGMHNGAAEFLPNGPGSLTLPAGLYRRFLARYSSTGAIVWATDSIHEDPDGQGATYVRALASSSDGSVRICGWIRGARVVFGQGSNTKVLQGASGVGTAFLASFDSNGRLSWVRSTVSGVAVSMGVVALPDGDTILAGWFRQRLDFGKVSEPLVTRPSLHRGYGYLARFSPQGTLKDVVAHDGPLAELQDVAVGGGRLLSVTIVGIGDVILDGFRVTSAHHGDSMVVQRCYDWTTQMATGFEKGKWLLAEEIHIPGLYDSGLAKLAYKSSAARTGKKGLRIIANKKRKRKSNIAIAYEIVSRKYETGVIRFAFHFRIPDDPDNKGQNGPTFTIQNTRFLDPQTLATETLEVGFSYTVNPWDPLYQKWRIWTGGGNDPWTLLPGGPTLQRGEWYKATMTADFTNMRYRSIVIEAPGNASFPVYRRLLDTTIPSTTAKGWKEESMVVSIEAENQYVDFGTYPKAKPTSYWIEADDLTVHRADGR